MRQTAVLTSLSRNGINQPCNLTPVLSFPLPNKGFRQSIKCRGYAQKLLLRQLLHFCIPVLGAFRFPQTAVFFQQSLGEQGKQQRPAYQSSYPNRVQQRHIYVKQKNAGG